jgi:hypothetical protein
MSEQEILRHRLDRAFARGEDISDSRKPEPVLSIVELDERSARRAAILSILARARHLDGLAQA